MARNGATIKGVKGFSKHPVVAISPNGEAKHFDSITAVQRFLKYPKKSQPVGKAIKRKYPVRAIKSCTRRTGLLWETTASAFLVTEILMVIPPRLCVVKEH